MISAAQMLATNCTFADTGVDGYTSPAAGVDIEPGSPHTLLDGIKFIDCTASDNVGAGFNLSPGYGGAATKTNVTISFDRCSVRGGLGTGFASGTSSHLWPMGHVHVTDCSVSDTAGAGIGFRNVASGIMTVYHNITLTNVAVGYQRTRDLNPSTNPFKEGVNGTLAYTPFGLRVYTDLYAANVWLMCAIVATPLDHEALAAKLRWGDLAAGRLPSPAAVGVWVLFTTYTPLLDLSIAAKYGWPSAFLPWAIWMRYLIFGHLQFAGAPVAGKHPLLRQLTLPEHLMLERFAWALGPYPAFDLYCIHTGQWDGKTIGRPGGVLLVVTELAVVLVWWVTWARHVFKPPNNSSLEDRAQILVKAYLSGIAQLPIQQLLHAIALWSDQPDNDELTTLEGAATNGFDVRRPFSKSLHAYHQLQFEINVDLCQQLTEHCRPP